MQNHILVLATRNQGKIKEFSALLKQFDPGFYFKGLDDFSGLGELPEPGQTFAENALYKAREVARFTGLVSIADDSGLEVKALGGRPGVHSARYGGPGATDQQNIDKLLKALAGVPEHRREACFKCVITVCTPKGEYCQATGIWEGRIAFVPRGSAGFGYDPVFIDLETGLTAAELSFVQKNKKSHRAQALKELLRLWPGFWQRVCGQS